MQTVPTWALMRVVEDDEAFRNIEPGEVIFRHGEAGDYMAIVLRGSVEIRRADARIAVIGSGSVFGEMALVDDLPRSADALALTHGRIALITRKRFTALVRHEPEFALSIMRILTERLRLQLDT